jgi:hypothetical protein
MGADETDPVNGHARLALMTSGILYVMSFFLPAVMGAPHHFFAGYQAFLMSLIGPLFFSMIVLCSPHPLGLLPLVTLCPWLANVAYWLAVRRLCNGRRRGVVSLAILAVFLGLSAVACYFVSTSLLAHGGRAPGVFPFREGYWLWLGSMALLALGCWNRGGDRSSEKTNLKLAQYWDD